MENRFYVVMREESEEMSAGIVAGYSDYKKAYARADKENTEGYGWYYVTTVFVDKED